jgi:hypothetical protein
MHLSDVTQQGRSQHDVPNPDPSYRFYNDWGCGYSGEFVFNNPEFTQLKFKAVIEPCQARTGGPELPAGSMRVVYELEARRPRRLRAARSVQHPLERGAKR